MATHYGRIGDTSMSNSKHHNIDANDSQADINDLEILNLPFKLD